MYSWVSNLLNVLIITYVIINTLYYNFLIYAASLHLAQMHVSALLHALASLTAGHQQDVSSSPALFEEEALSVTSYLCQWNAPCKQKKRAMLISKATFQKHVYGRQQKH